MQLKLRRIICAQNYDADKVMKPTRLHSSMVILFLAICSAVCAGTCHLSPCDAIQEMKKEIVKYSSAIAEPTHGELLEVRLAKLERRVRSVEQRSM
jgi:hypothetical protein